MPRVESTASPATLHHAKLGNPVMGDFPAMAAIFDDTEGDFDETKVLISWSIASWSIS